MGYGSRTSRAQIHCQAQGRGIEQTSLGPFWNTAASSNSPRAVLLNAEGSKHGPQGWASGCGEVKWPRIFLHLTAAPEFLKSWGIQVAVWLKGMLLGDLSFIYTLHNIEDQLFIPKNYFY